MQDERPIPVSPRARFSINAVLWGTSVAAVAFAALRSEYVETFAALFVICVLISAFAAAVLASEYGRDAVRDSFCLALAFCLAACLFVTLAAAILTQFE